MQMKRMVKIKFYFRMNLKVISLKRQFNYSHEPETEDLKLQSTHS